MINRHGSRATWAVACLLTLNGCVGALLGGGKPDALYRFGATPFVKSNGSTALPRRILAIPTPQFAPAIGGDRILTSQGAETSYVKDMRWVASAPALYAASVETTIANRAPDIVLANRNNAGNAGAVLTVLVDRFEASYPTSGAALPVVMVEGSAILYDRPGKRIIGRYTIAVTQSVSVNTGAGIAAAFDAAVNRSVVQLVDWTNVTMPLPGKIRP